jgi:hypothetical protein
MTIATILEYPEARPVIEMSVSYCRKLPIIAALAAFPLMAAADPLDSSLACHLDAHDFIAPLIQNGSINAKASRVEDNSVNAFYPAKGTDLRAFGYSVVAVVGYQKDDPLFQRGAGKPIGDSAYGAVVLGSTNGVKSKVDALGSTAIVHHVAPFITAIFCDKRSDATIDSASRGK